MNRIVTISREFGSGGRTIGRMLAERLGIKCYDAEIIEKIAEKSGYSKDYILSEGEKTPTIWVSPALGSPSLSEHDRLWAMQCKAILEIAEEAPCVIVGRCADYVLRGKADALNAFIHADEDFRAKRIVDVYGESSEKPIDRIRAKDKARAAYHRYYTDTKWGNAANYDIALNSGTLGIEKCVDILEELY